ncbi:MAG: class I SAM-dependent RNA methyltransferase [Pseudomonadota bacterium]
MNETEEILRIAAKGDGVTASGRHVKGAVPGDAVRADGNIEAGPHHVLPVCSHFGLCGGCQLQIADEHALRDFVTSRALNAAHGQGLEPKELLETHLSPPRARRRATLHASRTKKGLVLGFKEGGSHRIVNLRECPVIAPELASCVPRLRSLLAQIGGEGAIDVGLALCDQGVDISFSNISLDGLSATEALLDYATDMGAARISVDHGFGSETVWEPEPVTISFSGLAVPLPVGAFLQATCDAEVRMVNDARAWLDGAGPMVDLFAGLGTFAFGLSEAHKVLAVEADRAAHTACRLAARRASRPVHALHRDLFRNPLGPAELSRFEAVLLDPPRAGAKAQIAEIAASGLARVVYVSCNPSSWSRDAALLDRAGFHLEALRAIGQFRWSTHVELVSLFAR